jgi:CBS domain-containing protein
VSVDEKPIGDIRVSDVLKDVGKLMKPAVVSTSATLRDAVDAIIEDSDTRKVYVVDAEGKIVGTITLETLLRQAGYRFGVRTPGMTSLLRMLAEMAKDKVTEVMAKPVKVFDDELLTNVTRLMVEHHLNDLPVVDRDGKIVGELNGLDILKAARKFWEK